MQHNKSWLASRVTVRIQAVYALRVKITYELSAEGSTSLHANAVRSAHWIRGIQGVAGRIPYQRVPGTRALVGGQLLGNVAGGGATFALLLRAVRASLAKSGFLRST